MKIEFTHIDADLFKDIRIGEVFEFGICYYIKVNSSEYEPNAMSLNTFELRVFTGTDKVHLLNATLTIER